MTAVLAVLCFAQDSLEFKAGTAQAEVPLGEWIQLDVTVTNRSGGPREAPLPALDERVLSFDIEWPESRTSFKYTVTPVDPQTASRMPPASATLAPGAAFTTAVRIPAVRVGRWSVTGVYRAGGKEIRSGPVQVQVTPAQGAAGPEKTLLALATLRFDEKDHLLWIRLEPDLAPHSVCQFARLVKLGFYDGINVFSVVRGNWIRAGCPYDNGFGTAGFTFATEVDRQKLLEPAPVFDEGTVGLCEGRRADTVASQFFVCLRRIAYLDKKFTVIGRVLLDRGSPPGGEVLRSAERHAEPEIDGDRPTRQVVVKSIELRTE